MGKGKFREALIGVDERTPAVLPLEERLSLLRFAALFKDPGFSPVTDESKLRAGNYAKSIRDDAIVEFVLFLKESSFLFPKTLLNRLKPVVEKHERLFEASVLQPELLSRECVRTLRLQISYCYHRGFFSTMATEEQLLMIFKNDYLSTLLSLLAGPQYVDLTGASVEKQDSGFVPLPLFHDSDKYLGYWAREEGRYGSSCSRENLGEESGPYEHDNDWCDRI